MKKLLLLSAFLMAKVFAVQPVTGVWADSSGLQKRTGYSIEAQNNFLLLSMYTYSENNASTNPTWYNAGGFLTQNQDGTAQGTFDLYTVSDNRAPGSSGNIPAGSLDIVFKDRETAEIKWNNFPGHSQSNSTIKKFWFLGTGVTPQAKRLAAVGVWQYSVSKFSDDKAFLVSYYDPAKFKEKYKAISGNDGSDRALIGKVFGSSTDNVVMIYSGNGNSMTLIKDSDGFDYFLIGRGGAEYSKGSTARVFAGGQPSGNSEFKYLSTGVQVGYKDDSGKIIPRDLDGGADFDADTLNDMLNRLNELTAD